MTNKELQLIFKNEILREEFEEDIHYRAGDRWDFELKEYTDSKGRTSYETMYAYECYVTGHKRYFESQKDKK
jgi:hypothetical protein